MADHWLRHPNNQSEGIENLLFDKEVMWVPEQRIKELLFAGKSVRSPLYTKEEVRDHLTAYGVGQGMLSNCMPVTMWRARNLGISVGVMRLLPDLEVMYNLKPDGDYLRHAFQVQERLVATGTERRLDLEYALQTA
jgi:hypothetical protein